MSTIDKSELPSEDIAVIAGVIRTLKILAKGTVCIHIDVDPAYRNTAMCVFGEPGATVAIARLKLEANELSST